MAVIRRAGVAVALVVSIYAGALELPVQKGKSGQAFLASQTLGAVHRLQLAGFFQGPISGPVNYVYDELGRLVGAVASTGESVGYTYDPVGNILSINRYSSGQIAMFTFTPKSGPIGTNVTIFGANFSSNPTQDSVSFNGLTAAIISATATKLVVAVPAGATSGPLTISSPGGLVTTSDSFTVTNSDGRPRIDSFTPQIVAPTTGVTITGANFDTTPANDRLMVNVTAGLNPASASTSTMSLTTPSATGSGRISLSTPKGTVTSGDLYIPPPGYTVASVGATGRTTSGAPAPVALSTANQIGMVLFDAKKGQMVSAVASGSTFGSTCSFYLYDPSNNGIVNSRGPGLGNGGCSTSGGFYDSQQLPASGTYALLLSPGNSVGHATVTPYLFDDIQGTAVLNSSITATTSVPGQNIRYLLLGSANQHVSISILSSNFTSCSLTVFQPDGTALITSTCNNGSSFIDVPTLSQNGLHTILLDPAGTATGSVTFKVNDATDVTGAIPIDGTLTTITTTVPGQNAKLTFNGTAGQIITARIQNVSFSSGITMTLLDPTGAQVNHTGNIGISTVFMDSAKYCLVGGSGAQYWCGTITLPSTGTYTVFLNPSGANSGQAKVWLYSIPSDAVIAGTLGGSQINVPSTMPGQNTKITFAGNQNGRVSISFSGGNFTGSAGGSGLQFQVLLPDGTPLGGFSGGGAFAFSPATSGFVDYNDIYVFPTAGTYTLLLDPMNDSTGAVNVNLYDATDVAVPISADGSAHAITTTSPGQNVHLNFTPTIGQKISALLSSSTYSSLPSLILRRIDSGGSVFNVAFGGSDSGNSYIDAFTITQSGNYYLFVDPSNMLTGSATVALYTITDLSGTADPSGTPVTAAIATPGQNGTYTFSANSGQSLTLAVSTASFSTGRCTISILNPNGVTLGLRDCATIGSSSWTLAQTGTFKTVIDPTQSATGTITFSVTVH